jgi:hypothetical protein
VTGLARAIVRQWVAEHERENGAGSSAPPG